MSKDTCCSFMLEDGANNFPWTYRSTILLSAFCVLCQLFDPLGQAEES